jgi:DNA-binding PadR family transcriptional regulator
MKYQLLERDKFKYISLVLLNEIINFQNYFSVKAEGEDVFLEPYLKFMKEKGVLEVKDGKYIPTAKGREELVNLYNKYYEYLKIFDIYCAVDLEKGEFAFASINNDFSEADWFNFLENERFSDVRVAVADFKGLNPTEIVFMSFLNENRFDCTADRWQYNLTGEAIWKEIEEICNTAVDVDYLKADGVLEDVIKQGTELAMKLIKEADDAIAAEEEDLNSDDTEVIEETVVEEYVDVVPMPYYPYSYWDPYYDPYYISPLWLVPAILLF